MNMRLSVRLALSLIGIGVLSTAYMAQRADASPGAVSLHQGLNTYEHGCWGFGAAHWQGASEGVDDHDSFCGFLILGPMRYWTYIWSEVDGAPHPLNADVRPDDSTSTITFYLGFQCTYGDTFTMDFDHWLNVAVGHAGGLPGFNFPNEDVYITINGQTYDAKKTTRIDLPHLSGTFTAREPHMTGTITFVPRPTVETLAATEVTYTTATLQGKINNNAKACDYWFTYWTQGGDVFTSECGSGVDGPQTFSTTISGLKAETTYSYQAHASNGASPGDGETKTFTTPGLLADLSQDAPHILRIDNVHSKMPTRTFQLVYEAGATEGGDDAADSEFSDFTGVQVPLLLTKVGVKYLQADARDPSSKTPFYLEQVFYSDWGFARVSGGDTNVLAFSFPMESNGSFADRLITFQEYLPGPADSNVPDPNAESYPVYDVRQLIADGNGVGVVALPDLPSKMYNGTGHYFVVRTDKISLADFNDDHVVDGNDYAVVLRDLGKVGNSMGDIASLKDDGTLVLGVPDGKVDETDVAGFEQEQARVEALIAAIHGDGGIPDDSTEASSTLSSEGFEGSLGSE